MSVSSLYRCYDPHSTFHHQINRHVPGVGNKEKEDEFDSKRIKLNKSQAEVFGAAFGAAWKALNQ
jgi:hypothetical protein